MKTNLKKYIAALAFFPLLFASCSDSFLDQGNNPNKETEGTWWNNAANVERALVAVYNPIRDHMYGYYGVFCGIWNHSMRADDLYPTRGEEAFAWEVLSFTNTPESGYASNLWENLYKSIQYANSFLFYAPNSPADPNKLKEWMAEAHFMRGFNYFLLQQNYREAVLRTLPEKEAPEHIPYSSQEDLLKQCEEDFKAAAAALPDTRPAEENGRVTKGAALAMLGKTYLWQKRYDEAKKQLADVINGPYGYDLVEYENNFRDDTEFNKESIFEINYEFVPGTSDDLWGNQNGTNASMGNNMANFFGPEFRKGGWYKMQPSAHLIDEYIVEERPAGSDSRWDKRLYTTCYFNYEDYNDVKKNEIFYGDADFEEMWEGCLNKKLKPMPVFPTINGKPGRFLFKKWTSWWVEAGASMYAGNDARKNNLRVMRFAEVLFLHAEACLQTGDIAGAMADINRIRIRAGLAEKQISDSNAAWKELRHQKLLEFCGENIRWYDLIRWYDAAELKAYLMDTKDPTQNITAFEAKHMYLPIPQSEVDANHALEQKEDWR